MGQRHQIYIVTKGKKEKGRSEYTCLGAFHHQWNYGLTATSNAIRLVDAIELGKRPESEFEAVFKRMIEAIERGSFNKDSIAIKNTYKQLKIKHTYQAIKEFIAI